MQHKARLIGLPKLQPIVTILVATCNGQLFLEEQLLSIESQTWPNVDLLISDDGSSDSTLEIASSFVQGWKKGKVVIIGGPQEGFAENFRSMLLNDNVNGDFVAFCDQDDIWKPEKLSNAINVLSEAEPGQPMLYCSRTRFYPDGGKIRMSPHFRKPPSFRNALVQSIAGGNTMVMNRVAFDLLRESARRTSFVSHDWWAYLIVTGCGGRICYNPQADILYRQHGTNLVGANSTFMARVDRVRMLLNGRFRHWTEVNLAGLDLCVDMLTPKARKRLMDFRDVRHSSLIKRLRALRKSEVYRQTFFGQVGLKVGCALGLL